VSSAEPPLSPMGVDRRWVELITEKWGGRPHYRTSVEVLGRDEHGTWLWGKAGRIVHRGDEEFLVDEPALSVVPDDQWWWTLWFVGHPDLEIYVNVATPTLWTPESATSTDLDLDVVRFTDGRVEIVDRDEFELHQLQLGYPTEIIEAAERSAREVLTLVQLRTPPFDLATPARWIERGQALSAE
jgi:uncharacterized protein